jgi:hypothetical protein
MVQLTTSTLLAIMLVAPCFAVPVTPPNAQGSNTAVGPAALQPKLPQIHAEKHHTEKTHTEKEHVEKKRTKKIRIHVRPRHVVHRNKHPRHKEAIRNVAVRLSKRSDGADLSERDIEDIQLAIREFDDLVTREPIFGGLWKRVKHLVTVKNIKTGMDIAKSLKARELSPELEELAAREPLVDAIWKTVKEISAPTEHSDAASKPNSIVAREDNPDMYERDLEESELDAREPEPEPFFKSLWRKIKPVATPHNIKAASDLVRTFTREEQSEVFERDYELNELD